MKVDNNELTYRQQIEQVYETKKRKFLWVIIVLAVACFISFCFDIATGPSDITFRQVLAVIFGDNSVDESVKIIVHTVRMPYAIMALLVGMALSVAGAEMQTVLNNPLASPFTLGVSAAATFGAALAIVLGISLPFINQNWIVSFNAFLFAFGSVLLLQFLMHWRRAGVGVLVLFGIAMVFAFNALVALLHYIASAETLQQIIFWNMGSLARADWEKVQLLGIVIAVVIPFTLMASWKMTVLRLGEERAVSIGINIKRLRFASLLRISLLAATSVAFVGTIGFIGLVGPHIARMLVGENHRYWFPASIFCGALIMSLSSIASKILIPGALLPVGVVTAIVGVPVFVYMIISKSKTLG